MSVNINYLLIGNSRLHWAKNVENKYRFFHTQKNNRTPKNINLDNLIWASVGTLPDLLLNKENEITTRDINLKNLPSHFGVDRALACFEAFQTIKNPLKKDLLVADCGTTLSITKLTAKGSIIGGQIAPGFLTQLKSMAQYTKNLTMPKNHDIPIQEFLIQTEESMLKGVLNSIIGVINFSFNPFKDILIICGGDSKLISKILKKKHKEIVIAPNLVMQGMISHINKKNNLL